MKFIRRLYQRLFVQHLCHAFLMNRPGSELDCEDCFLVLVVDVADMDAAAAVEEEEEPCTCTFCDSTRCPYCGHPKEERSCQFCDWPQGTSW